MRTQRSAKTQAKINIRKSTNEFRRKKLEFNSPPEICRDGIEETENKSTSSSESFKSTDSENKKDKMTTFRNVIKLINHFDGKYVNLDRFIKSIQLAMSSEKALDIPENEEMKINILNYIIINLIDAESYDLIKSETINSVEELQKALTKISLKNIEPEFILSQIYGCKQRDDENVESYGQEIKNLGKIYEAALEISSSDTDLTPIKQYNERLIIKSFIRGTRPKLKSLILSQEFNTLDECITWSSSKEKEMNFGKFSYEAMENLEEEEMNFDPYRDQERYDKFERERNFN